MAFVTGAFSLVAAMALTHKLDWAGGADIPRIFSDTVGFGCFRRTSSQDLHRPKSRTDR